MRRLTLVLCLVATPLFAQEWSDPNIHVTFADGSERLVPVVVTHDVPVIVEFRDAPLALVASRSAKTAMADYQWTRAQFRNDLTSIVNRGVSAKTAIAAPEFKREYFEALNGVALTVPREALAALRALPYVKRVHLDKPVQASAITTPVNVSLIRADRVWTDLGTKGKGVVVAIIDTGIDYRHPALGGCLGPGCRVLGGHDFVNDDDDPLDDHFHGTHVAGIVGGNSEDLIGVAPEVSFLGYKVLNSKGSGSESDVIAAIERAIDPNGDGDLRDHADVVNLSLGGYGNADDAASTAIDNATAAGTLFAVAAGNAGQPHSVDSPGTARLAVTVGATDLGDHIASFSSRGPSPKLISIKPDVLAPGVGIRSSMPNGQYGSLSGTSMATPHVAGVAALIRALHPDWSPSRVKAQLMGSSTTIGEDVMVQGAGRIDALRAATPQVVVNPPSMSLGLDPVKQTTWATSATLRVTNGTDRAVSYAVSGASVAGVTTTISSSKVSLQPGESTDLTVDFNFANGSVSPILGSFSIGGAVTLRGSDSADVIRIPWGAVKAARALVSYDRELSSALWIDQTAGVFTNAAPISENGDSEVLLAPGKYDFFMYSVDTDVKTKQVNDAQVFFLEGQNLDGDTHIGLSAAQASHAVRFDGRDENGQPLVGSDLSGYAASASIELPQTGKIKSVSLPALALRTWHFGDISESDTVVPHELFYNAAKRKMYIVPQRALKGVSADATLTAGGSALKRADVNVFSGQSQFADRRILIGALGFSPPGYGTRSVTLTVDNNGATSYLFPNSVFIGPEALEGFSFGVSYNSIVDGTSQFTTPALRIVNDRIVSAATTTNLPPWSWNGNAFSFGVGLVYPLQSFGNSVLPLRPSIYTDFAGELNEVRTQQRFRTTTSIFNSDGNVQTTGSRYPQTVDMSVKGKYRIEAVDSTTQLFPTVPRTATVIMNLDSSRSDYFPPVFTALMLFDGAGQLVTRLEPNGGGSLQFAAADFTYTGVIGAVTKTYGSVRAESTKASYRVSGTSDWLPLGVTQVVEDPNNGILFRADLSPLTNIAGARQFYDLKLDIEDPSGNSTSYQLAPAFSVGDEVGPRRRAAR
jgi:subtilisin family serine protease